MHPRAAQLIDSLGLSPHPEGGYYREVYRSSSGVTVEDGRGRRSALTTIYFLLVAGEVSRWHRVRSDEAWCFVEGDPLELLEADPRFERIESRRLGPYGPGLTPVRVVEADWWQAARPTGAYTLVTCTVGPGFDFADFTMLRDMPEDAERMRRLEQGAGALI